MARLQFLGRELSNVTGVVINKQMRSSLCGSVEMNPIIIHEDVGLVPGLLHWVKDLALLWLWCMPAAEALTGPLARELPYAVGAALKKQKTKQNKPNKLPKYRSSNPIPGHISRENHNVKRYMHPSVHSSTIYNSQDVEAT